MKDFKGTKGKWKHYKNQDTWIVSDMEGAGIFVQAKSSVSSPYHAEANAKLASYSPEMLKMLEDILDQREDGREYVSISDIRKLIKNATE